MPDRIITLYKVRHYIDLGARVDSEQVKVTTKSYVPVDTTYSKLCLRKYIPKGRLSRFDIGFTPEEAIQLALKSANDAIRRAEIDLQRAEGRLNDIEALR